MKRYLISLVLSGSVCAIFASAVVVAQAPATPPAALPDAKPTEIKQGTKVELKAELPVEIPVIKKAVAQVQAPQVVAARRVANVENLVQRNIRQGRASVRAELIFVRKVCAVDTEQLRRINQDAERALKDAATKWAENQQLPRGADAAARLAIARKAQSADGIKALQEELALVMKKNLTPEQFSRYEAEIEKRNESRRRAALHYLIDALDRDLFLSDQQRVKLTDALVSNWDDSWCTSLEYVLYGNQFYPLGTDPYVVPILNNAQRRIWQGTQKVGANWGFGSVMGNLVNDNDALEEELGMERKIEPIQEVGVAVPAFPGQVPAMGLLPGQVPAIGVRKGRIMIDTQKAVVKDVPDK
jgi:hypothetical protein